MRAILRAIVAGCIFAGSSASGFGHQAMIDDFKTNPQKNWRFVADTVMGGVSSGAVEFKTRDGVSVAQMTGKVSTANNGGFIQIRHDLGASPSAETKGVRLVVRGNGQRYFIHLRTAGTLLPWQYYQAGFDATSEWSEVKLPLSSFKASVRLLRDTPKATSLKSVAVAAFGKDYEADVEVSEIAFY